MSELTVPQIDFSALGNLPTIYRQAQNENLRQRTLASLGQGGQADATALLKSGDLSLAQLGINMQNRAEDQAHTAGREKIADAHQKFMEGIAARTANRQDQSPLEKSQERLAVLKANNVDPNSPEGRSYLIGGEYSDPSSSKPMPVETIGGTKFMVRQPNGGYSLVDPSNLAAGGPVPSSPRVVGDAEGVANGLYDAPKAPGQRPALQGGGQPQAAQQPADLLSVDPKTGRREGYLQSLDPQVQGYIKKVADYEIDPRTTSVKGGMREKLMSAVAQYDPTYNQNTFGERSKAFKDFGTGAQGNTIKSFDVAIDHLSLLSDAATAMQNGNLQLLNSIRNKWREQTGNELPSNFNALKPLVSGEIAKAAIGSNNALADRQELREPLNAASSADQFNGVIQSYKGLMSGQLHGLRRQYEYTTGKKDFDKRLSENTLRELDRGGGATGGIKTLNSKEEFDGLPSGSEFIAPDGSHRIKP